MSDLDEAFLARFGHLFRAPAFDKARLAGLLGQLRYRSLAAGEGLLREGQSCAALPFVLEGRLRVFKVAESGREITLYRVGPGETCVLSSGCMTGAGEGGAGSIDAFPASVVAEEDTKAGFMQAGLVRRLLGESEDFRDFILSQFSSRMAGVMELVEEVAFRRVDERLSERLRDRARSARPALGRPVSPVAAGAEDSVRLVKATHQALAEEVGTSREVVSRILKDWEDRGLLRLGRGEIDLFPSFFRLS